MLTTVFGSMAIINSVSLGSLEPLCHGLFIIINNDMIGLYEAQTPFFKIYFSLSDFTQKQLQQPDRDNIIVSLTPLIWINLIV